MCDSEFCANELTEDSFNRAVLRLNHNILRLCFTQGGINVAGINPRHTIVNLLMVLSSPDLGFAGMIYAFGFVATAVSCSSVCYAACCLLLIIVKSLHSLCLKHKV